MLIALSSGCALRPPEVTPCTIINRDSAYCTPTDPNEAPFDKEIARMRGFSCFSPRDIGDIKIFLNRVIEEIGDKIE